jgi:Ca2+-binding RTX toxin-like protein
MSNMFSTLASQLFRKHPRKPRDGQRFVPIFEPLEPRRMLAITAAFSPATGVLNVFGDSLDNTIEISRNPAGGVLVNGGAVSIVGGAPTVANTTLMQVFGMSGDDTITLNEANGALPRANLFGGAGTDTMTGGSGADMVFGQSGGDTLLGKGGADLLFGGSASDTATGGDADDQVFGQSDDDRMVWNPGDDTDLNEGGAGVDSVEVNGGGGPEVFTTTANGVRVRFDRLDPSPFAIDIGTSENLVLNANGGNDSFSATGNLAALIKITVDGGAGEDTLLGSNGADMLLGGDGNDFIDGQQGVDVALMGAGNDTFQWDPGDGNDTIEGQADADTLLFNGSAIGEIFEFSANGSRVRFTRNIANIVLDLDDVEQFDLRMLGGADVAVVNDLSATDVTAINFLLAGVLGGSTGDAQADSIIVNGTAATDNVFVSSGATGVQVTGLKAIVNIITAEPAMDRLTVNLLGGDDALDATALAAAGIALTADGGDNDDVLLGGEGADTLLGGFGDDVLMGNGGLDVLDGGDGDDVEVQ